MKRFLLIALAACAAFAAAPHRAAASETCGIPDKGTLWIDFAGTTQYWQFFAQPNVIAATSNFIYPELFRAHGAKTVYWDMHFVRRVGTPLEPFAPAVVINQANRMYDAASMSLGCANPMITENELNGANLITPWSPTNAQYRRNVLIYLQTLAERGARPVLLVPSKPFLGDQEAIDWWRQAARYADIVSEAYFSAARMAKLGPIAGSRQMRELFRVRIAPYTEIGIPTRQLGIMLGFHTTPGSGGRERAPLRAWLEVTKLQTLAARQVAKELALRSVWSWGWGVFGASSPENDPDKPLALCVYLWTRSPSLCNGPKAAGRKFNTSRVEGQLVFPRGVRCTVSGRRLDWGAINGLTRVTGDPDVSFTAVYARTVASILQPLKAKQVAEAEKAVVAAHFGSYRRYRGALARAHATRAVALGVIADELRRALTEQRLHASNPSAADVREYLETFADTEARLVESKTPAPWLGGRRRGFALASDAPPQLFRLNGGGWTTIRTLLGPIQVRALAPAVPLGALPAALARPAVVSALKSLAREQAYESWILSRQHDYDYATICYRDRQPVPGVIPLTDYLPFLSAG